MGNYLSENANTNNSESTNRKRSRNDSDSNVETIRENDLLSTPQKKRVKTTSYIYDKLFIEGEASDVIIVALDYEWKLHKIYLSQSPYFESMFGQSWKEASMHKIEIAIPDSNIDKEALQVAFGSCYRDEVMIAPDRVVNVLAAGAMFQLDGLVAQCTSVMEDSISVLTVCAYYDAADLYSISTVKTACVTWMEQNMMGYHALTSGNDVAVEKMLKQMSTDFMYKVVGSPLLFVNPVENDVYLTLKRWMYLRLHLDWVRLHPGDLRQASDTFFKERRGETATAFLDTEEGRQFRSPFLRLRLAHIINDYVALKSLHSDNIIPQDWLAPVHTSQWLSMLRLECGSDSGPTEALEPGSFFENCVRCGRILVRDQTYCWRWTGFHYGNDLLITYRQKMLLIKRNVNGHETSLSVSQRAKRSTLVK